MIRSEWRGGPHATQALSLGLLDSLICVKFEALSLVHRNVNGHTANRLLYPRSGDHVGFPPREATKGAHKQSSLFLPVATEEQVCAIRHRRQHPGG